MKKNVLQIMILSLFALLIFSNGIFAQTKIISGTIYNSANDKPLPEITVAIQGVNVSTVTDKKGNYILNVPDTMETIKFSEFFAMNIVEIKTISSNKIDIYLSQKDIFDLTLEELTRVEVVTASKKAEPMDKTPNIMYVVTKEEIQLRGYKNLEDVLVTIPGLGVFHKDIQLVSQVRGIAPNDNEKITFMINGRCINQVYEPEIFNGAIRLENLERIEIIVGPGSVLYGAETLCAIVNLITKQTNKTEIYLSAGDLETRSVTTNFGQTGNKGNIFVSASYAERGGYDAWDADSNSPGNVALHGFYWKTLSEFYYINTSKLSELELPFLFFKLTNS